MEHVLSVREPEQVVPAWRYGKAEFSAWVMIRPSRSSKSACPIPRFMPRFASGLIGRRESKETMGSRGEKWPEPSFTRRGRLELVKGTLINGNGQEQAFGRPSLV